MRLSIALFLTFACGLLAAQPKVTASLDRETIFEGEGVKLTVEFVGDPGTAEPDFSALSEDFLIGSTAMTSQFSFVDNQRQVSTSWSVELEPRTTGEIIIPPIPVGGSTTEPLTLTVMPRQSTGGGTEDVFLEIEASDVEPYVHAQVLLTVKLYHVNPLTEGRLTEPDLPDAVVERLGEDRAYPATINGVRYRVLERRFAVFPERSGPMTIEPVGFRGRVADRGSRFNSFFDPGRRVRVTSQPITLDVRPRPASYPDEPWIPAAQLELKETWPEGGAEFVVGEPATRRVEVRARGLLSVQLPELEIPKLPDLKVYPDKANTQSRTDGTWVIGEREQSYALVPTRAGRMVLPEIRIPWWDTEQDRLREAVIPAREILVRPAAALAAPPSSTQRDVDPSSGPVADGGPWRWIAVGAMVLWLLTLAGWWRERRDRSAPSSEKNTEASGGAWRNRLKQACRDNDPTLATSALLGWASVVHGQPVRNLESLAARVESPELSREIRRLDRVLYGGADEPWEGSELWRQVRSGLRTTTTRSGGDRPVLPPLYPESR